MSQSNDELLSLTTRMLRLRLNRPANIDVNILDPQLAENPISFGRLYGRFLGFFIRRPSNEVSFILMGRLIPFEDISHIFVYYLNSNYQTVQDPELKRLKGKVLDTAQFCVINVVSEACTHCDLSILLQTLEYSIEPRLMEESFTTKSILAHTGSSLLCFSHIIPYPECDFDEYNQSVEDLWKVVDSLRLRRIRLDDDSFFRTIPRDFSILQLKYNSHFVYAIHYLSSGCLMFLLPHCNEFESEECAQVLKTRIQSKMFNYKFNYVGATRYYGDFDTRCNSLEVVKACILALVMPFVIIRESDLSTVQYTKEYLGPFIQANRSVMNPPRVVGQTPPYSSESEMDVVLSVRFDGKDGEPEVITVSSSASSSQNTVIVSQSEFVSSQTTAIVSQSSLASSQSTVIVSQRNWERELRLLDFRKQMRAALESSIPPVDSMSARNDLTGSILKDVSVFLQNLPFLTVYWHGYTTSGVSQPVSLSLDEGSFKIAENDERFLIIPVLDEDVNVLIIVDKLRSEWGYINPDNKAHKDKELFQEINGVVNRCCPETEDMVGHPITISSHFHREYPLIHLLMSVFYLGKVFRLATRLPKKILYGEQAFRGYCHRICLQLQLQNLRFNLENGYVKDNGYLRPLAFVSYASPVNFERAIIPADQCIFCEKHGFGNLGSHIKMAHGGLSDKANVARHS